MALTGLSCLYRRGLKDCLSQKIWSYRVVVCSIAMHSLRAKVPPYFHSPLELACVDSESTNAVLQKSDAIHPTSTQIVRTPADRPLASYRVQLPEGGTGLDFQQKLWDILLTPERSSAHVCAM